MSRPIARPAEPLAPAVSARSRQRRAAAMAGLLGLALIFVAGFASMPAVHDAAHDGRHSAAFPCH